MGVEGELVLACLLYTSPNATAVLIIADRFPAKAKIPLVLESDGSSISEMLNTNADGHAVMAVFPYVPGKPQGTLKATAEGPGCLPSCLLYTSMNEQMPQTRSISAIT